MANQRVGQRYQIGDRVLKKVISQTKSFSPRQGTVKAAEERSDSRGYPSWYYKIKWDGSKISSIHAQQALLPLSLPAK
tara:strand:+ start:1527 stop:1760 length:234 start_codon:yes stop_codon:yes gene_type:complete